MPHTATIWPYRPDPADVTGVSRTRIPSMVSDPVTSIALVVGVVLVAFAGSLFWA
jgi:hypothetical protein